MVYKLVIDLCVGLFVIFLNLIEMIEICKEKRKKIIYEVILLSLSFADLLFGLSSTILCTILLLDQQNKIAVKIPYTTYFFFVLTSVFHLGIIAIDRVWFVLKPIHHRVNVTRKAVYKALILLWTLSIVVTTFLILYNHIFSGFTQTKSPLLTGNNTTNNGSYIEPEIPNPEPEIPNPELEIPNPEPEMSYVINSYNDMMQSLVAYVILTADVIIMTCNGFLVFLLQRKTGFSSKRPEVSRKENKASIVCIFTTVIFVLTTLPYSISKLATDYVDFWAKLLLVTNSGLNSVIYFYRGRFEWILKERKCTNASSKMDTISAISTPISTPTLTPISLRKIRFTNSQI